jgi:phage N-6-adenine-methyltransferase
MSGFTTGMRSSLTDQWATPQYVFDALNSEFHFTLDVCADESNHKCARYFTKEQDGLSQSWEEVCWMNPPYGRKIGKWTHKARESAKAGAIVVCLLPARTDTQWWAEDVMEATELCFIRGRLKFGGANTGALFPSVIAVFGTPKIPRMPYVDFREAVE